MAALRCGIAVCGFSSLCLDVYMVQETRTRVDFGRYSFRRVAWYDVRRGRYGFDLFVASVHVRPPPLTP